MIIPWKVDVPEDRIPFINWLLIMSIIAVFAWQFPQMKERHEKIEKIIEGKYILTQEDVNSIKSIKVPYDNYVLQGWSFKGMLSHIWLHGGIFHIAGNMLFLWIFGNSVCAKIGNILYLPIYILSGLFAAASYLIFSGNMPMLGASGAINGIVGMYLVFFPTNEITCYWTFTFIHWRQSETPSYVIILLWFAFDILGAIIGRSHIAYFAHIGGFTAGFAVAVILLKIKYITMEKYEKSLLQVFEERKEMSAPKVNNWGRAISGDFNQPNIEKPEPENKIEIPVLPAEAFFTQSAAMPDLQALEQAASPKNDFIRFACRCGKRIKMPIQYAGKKGKCPQCKKLIQIPNQ